MQMIFTIFSDVFETQTCQYAMHQGLLGGQNMEAPLAGATVTRTWSDGIPAPGATQPPSLRAAAVFEADATTCLHRGGWA